MILLLNGVTFGDQMEVGNPMYTTTFSFSFVDPTYFHRSLPLWSGAQRCWWLQVWCLLVTCSTCQPASSVNSTDVYVLIIVLSVKLFWV